MTQRISGLSEIIGDFDAVVVDQYGVLHDGKTAFPAALVALEGLHSAGIPMVALTNSGKLAATNAQRLARFGFPEHLFRSVVSSGELARERLAALPPGTRVRLMARQGETELVDGLDLVLAEDGDAAELIVMAAVEDDSTPLDTYQDRLRQYASAGIPALLVNPDHLVTGARGHRFGPGAVAERYREIGGPVDVLGKPDRAMFDAARQRLGDPAPDRILMIGDSPKHDIAGAKAVGFRTLLIEGGVQATLSGVAADYAMARLSWAE